jgi:CRP/FNR family transcriptional regulator, anaerobic regulatory protein
MDHAARGFSATLTDAGHLHRLAAKAEGLAAERFLASGRTVKISKGSSVFLQGDLLGDVVDLVSGVIVLERTGMAGERQVLAFALDGNMLGLAVDGRIHYTARAAVDCVIRRFPREALNRFVAEDGQFALAMIDAQSRMLRSAHDLILPLGRKAAVERVAAFLLHLRDRRLRFSANPDAERHDEQSLPMTRADIADFLGLTVESVSRAFAGLKSRGVIALDGPHRTRFLDEAGLRRFAGVEDFATGPQPSDI